MREFILGTILAPSLYCFVWIVLYGGVALRLERDSSEVGLCCKDTSGWFRSIDKLSNVIDEYDMEDKMVDISDFYWLCHNGNCGPCSTKIIKERRKLNETYADFLEEYQV